MQRLKMRHVSRVGTESYLLLPLVDESPVWPGVTNKPELQAVRKHPAVKEVPKLPVRCLQIGIFLAHNGLIHCQVCGNTKRGTQQYEERAQRHRKLRGKSKLSSPGKPCYLSPPNKHSTCKARVGACRKGWACMPLQICGCMLTRCVNGQSAHHDCCSDDDPRIQVEALPVCLQTPHCVRQDTPSRGKHPLAEDIHQSQIQHLQWEETRLQQYPGPYSTTYMKCPTVACDLGLSASRH